MTIKIYKYTSPSNKIYIGQTRKTQAGRAGYQGKGYERNKVFWRAIQKYGWDNFNYEILKEVETLEEANKLERYYIDLYQSNNPQYGYNISAGGFDGTNYEYLQRLEKMKEMWNSGAKVSDIQKEFNLNRGTLSYELLQAGIDGKERIRRSAGQYHSRPVFQYDKDFNLVNVFDSIAEAQRQTNTTNITRCCQQNEQKGCLKHKVGGYYWAY